MILSGTMTCQSQEEFDSIFGKLSGLPVKIATFDLDIVVEYEMTDQQTDAEVERVIIRLIDIIESVETHGFSLIGEKG